MSNIATGIAPRIREEFEIRDDAMMGDMVLTISPTTKTTAASTVAWSRVVSLSLANAAGTLHKWFTGYVVASIADVSTGGTAALATGDTFPYFVDGLASVTINGTGKWAAANTDTLTIANKTILGYTVTGGTSVETWST